MVRKITLVIGANLNQLITGGATLYIYIIWINIVPFFPNSTASIYVYIYIYLRQMPGLCPEPQPRQATHHHHHQHHHHHHQTLVEDLQNQDRSLTGVG